MRTKLTADFSRRQVRNAKKSGVWIPKLRAFARNSLGETGFAHGARAELTGFRAAPIPSAPSKTGRGAAVGSVIKKRRKKMRKHKKKKLLKRARHKRKR